MTERNPTCRLVLSWKPPTLSLLKPLPAVARCEKGAGTEYGLMV